MDDNSTSTVLSLARFNQNQSFSSNHFSKLDWVLPFAVTITLMFTSVWTLISLLYYGSKTGKWNKIQTKKSNQLNVGLVYISVVVCAFLCIAYLIATLLYMNIGFNEGEDHLCNVVGDVANCTYGFVLFSVYIFLWLRQRVFYQNQMLNVKYSRIVQVFSSISIIVILVVGVLVLVFISVPVNQYSSPDGCIYQPDNELRIGYWISVVLEGVFGQTILLGLFFYALKQSRGNKWSKNSKVPCCGTLIDIFYLQSDSYQSSPSVRTSVRFNGGFDPKRVLGQSTKPPDCQANNIRIILRKTLVFAMLSSTVDLVFQIHVHYIADAKHNRRLDAALGSVCAYLNVLFLILSFSAFKKMLCPFCINSSASNGSIVNCASLEAQ